MEHMGSETSPPYIDQKAAFIQMSGLTLAAHTDTTPLA